MKKHLVFLSLLLAAPVHARVNVLEPWSPGVDLDVPAAAWGHGFNFRYGKGDTDLLDVGYFLSHVPDQDWEVAGTLNYVAVDPPAPIASDSGLGDLAVAAKYKFPPARTPGTLRLAAEGGVSLPTGDPDSGLGAGGLGLLLGWDMEMPVQAVTGYAHFGVKLFAGGGDTHFGNAFSYTLGAKYLYQPDLALTADLRGFNRGKDKINGVRTPESVQELYLAPGAIWTPTRTPAQFFATLLLGLSDESTDFGLMGGLKF